MSEIHDSRGAASLSSNLLARKGRARPAMRQPELPGAFTLRLDAERHLRLRLASTLSSRSAQDILTAALDQYLAQIPESLPSPPYGSRR